MKKVQILKYSMVFLLMASGGWLIAKPDAEKRQVIEKSYPVSVNTQLEIINQFGEVHVDTWDKRELKVKIEIITLGKNDERAQRLMDKIGIDIREGSTISFETELSGNTNTKGDESFEINYTVSYPSDNKLSIENKFGDTYVDDRSGPTSLDISYGNLKTEGLSGFLNLELSFGKGFIGSTKSSDIEVKYSELDIESGEEMEMEQQFSDVQINKVNKLELESKYGDVKIGEVNSLRTDAQFSGFSIEKLNGQIYMEASYVSNFRIEELNRDFSRVDIEGKFSTYTISLQDGTSAYLEAEFSFANMSASNDLVDVYYKIKDDNKSEYKARIGGGDMNRKITVKSSYGDLRIR